MIIATPTCALITPFGSFISKRATGNVLKLAAIGVNRVPQQPAVIARAPAMIGSAPKENTKGTPIPAVMTVKAANAFPIIMENRTIPRT